MSALSAPRKRPQAPILALAILAALALALSLCLLSTERADAKSYELPQTNINAEVQPNGDIQIHENRIVSFDGSFSLVGWSFEGIPSSSTLRVDSVKVKRLGSHYEYEGGNNPSSGNGEYVPYDEYEEIDFNPTWRTQGSPGSGYYSVDSLYDSIYVFTNVHDEALMIDLTCTLVNGVVIYKDVAEVYWKYVGEGWAADSENVKCIVQLPLPEGEKAIAGENVRAWGHGPLDGSLVVNEDGTVTYTSPSVPSGEFAEARILFPPEWLTEVPAGTVTGYKNYDHLADVLEEEQAWADEANAKRAMGIAIVVLSILICLALLIWSVIMFFKYGKEHKSDFKEEYWRDVPDPNADPAEIGRLWRWDKESNKDFTATLMHLAHVGAITLNKGTYTDDRGRLIEDYYMAVVPVVADALTDPLDMRTIELLFDKFAYGQGKVGSDRLPSLWFDTIKLFGKKHPKRFMEEMKGWQGLLSSMVNKQDYFEFKSSKMQSLMFALAVFLIIAMVAISFVTVNFIPAIFGVPTALIMILLSRFMSRRTRHGNDVYAKCVALKRWLQEFSAIDERPPTDVKVWGEFMVYAYQFGVADQVLKELRSKVPEVFADDGFVDTPTYVPWWVWYHAGSAHMGGIASSAGSMFDQAIANTVTSAQSALSAASGGGSGFGGGGFSSGGGFGGGFSGGGGGGFGGGGFAR